MVTIYTASAMHSSIGSRASIMNQSPQVFQDAPDHFVDAGSDEDIRKYGRYHTIYRTIL